jgi:hypothetical protein
MQRNPDHIDAAGMCVSRPAVLHSEREAPGAVRARSIRRPASSRPQTLLGTVLVSGTVTAIALFTTGCSNDPSFSVGDCVRIEHRTLDSRLKSADCGAAQGTFDPSERTYRVDSIIDNTNGGCPQLRGFFPVEFVDEPDGVTYCLVQES